MRWQLLIVMMLGCAVDDEATEIEDSEQAIIAGKASTAAQDAVVLLRIGDRAQCSGTLVAPNLLLTARHCVSGTDEGIQCSPSGHAIQGGEVGADFPAQSLVVYAGHSAPTAVALGKRVLHDSSRNLCDHDLALVLLDRDVTSVPIASLRLTDDTEIGERATAVGWGLTKAGTLPAKRMQRANVPILDVGPSASASSHELVVGEAICSGDSGGPLLSHVGAVIGVVSYGGNGHYDPDNRAGSCVGKSTRNTYTRVAPFASVIQSAFALAHHTPRRE